MIHQTRGINGWVWIIIIILVVVAGIAAWVMLSGDGSSAASVGSSGVPQPPALPSR